MPRMRTAFAAALLAALTAPPALAADLSLGYLIETQIRPWLANPALVAAIKEQNRRTAGLSQAEIDAMDRAWASEIGQKEQPTIRAVASSPASALMRDKLLLAKGLFTEIIVMDARGLNVAVTDATSDYWQGDEAKWQKTFAAGAEAVHVDELRRDESTHLAQRQVSLTVVDPADGAPIGAITVAVNADRME
ncbi:MAG TPA: hypothetical protein VEB20_23665 [Azospirillaceae bacterium]|nr:hypothetical protein [Azospirillaceae bacterium]